MVNFGKVMKKHTDSELIKSYQNGNEKALELLLDRHQVSLFNFIYYKVIDRDLANDIFQDTFIKVILNLKEGKYNDEGKFIIWAKRISYNLIIDHFRLKTKHNKVSDTTYDNEEYSIFESIKETEKNIEEQLIDFQISEDLNKMVQLLPENQREVVDLRYFKDLSFKEIAEHTNTSINTTLGRVRYALINLRKLIEENNIILTK